MYVHKFSHSYLILLAELLLKLAFLSQGCNCMANKIFLPSCELDFALTWLQFPWLGFWLQFGG